ncbi:MAG: hypothetical protein ACREPX_00060 [Rhodanobacteraceae bacterium]
MRFFDRFRRNVADVLGLFIGPAVVACLPWPAAFAVLKLLARRGIGFSNEADAAWNIAQPHLRDADMREWKMRARLMKWVERVDTYLTLMHGSQWWKRHVDVVGEFPPGAAPYLLLTYHWGAGNWVWKLLREHAIPAYFLARRPEALDFGTSRVALWYGRLRVWGLSRIGSLGPLYTGDSSRQIKETWTRGESVVGMLDLPARGEQKTERVPLLDGQVRLPSGLVRLAETSGTRVVLLSCGLDFDTGRRRLRIETLAEGLDVAGVLTRYAGHLDARLHDAPEAWHMWHEADLIFVDGS